MHLFTQSPLGADGEAIADNEHPDHQLRIDRGTPNVTVERLQLPPNLTQIKEPINLAKDVISRNMLIKTKIVEQSLRCRLRPHHSIPPSQITRKTESRPPPASKPD